MIELEGVPIHNVIYRALSRNSYANPYNSCVWLIELLVVIAIIAILAAILFPVFAQAKVSAKKASSISNLKQTALSTMIYTADYDDSFPVPTPRSMELLRDSDRLRCDLSEWLGRQRLLSEHGRRGPVGQHNRALSKESGRHSVRRRSRRAAPFVRNSDCWSADPPDHSKASTACFTA